MEHVTEGDLERPSQWGPVVWRVLHSAATLRDTAALERVLRDLGQLLPCKYCRRSLRCLWPRVRALDVATASERVWILHNMVSFKIHCSQGATVTEALARSAPLAVLRRYRPRLGAQDERAARRVARVIATCARRRGAAAQRNGTLARFQRDFDALLTALRPSR